MADDYIPHADADFHDWLGQFSTYISTNTAALGLTPADVTPLTNATTGWNSAYPAHQTAQSAASAAKTTKDQARGTAENVARPLAQRLQVSPAVTDAQRSQMQIKVRATTRTRVSVPATAPMATVDTSQRLQHSIDFRDSASPSSRKKPSGVAGCEIWAKVGAPAPTDVSQMTYGPPTQPRRIWPHTPARRPGRWSGIGCAGSTRAARKARGANPSARPLRGENVGAEVTRL